MNKAIKRGCLDRTVCVVLDQREEDAEWALYCACVANAFADKLGSFEDFRKRFGSGSRKRETTEKEQTVNVNLEVQKSNKILSGFVPPKKGGT